MDNSEIDNTTPPPAQATSGEGFGFMDAADAENNIAPPQAAYQVLARKYRPQNFDDLIGQDAMVRTLRNAFASGRIAHAFMLTGVRGVGKTTTARILARALNYHTETCDHPSADMPEHGTHCAAIMEGRHVDILEMDAASRTGIDDIREIIDNVRYAPASARYKVYIIDEVHMLSTQAFNGLLKTLEEPPAHVKFIFATTEIRKVPVTILSRCQRFDLRRLSHTDMDQLLTRTCMAEKIELQDEARALLARAAEGSARDALSLLDRIWAHAGDEIASLGMDEIRSLLGLADRGQILDLFDLTLQGKIAEALAAFAALYDLGTDALMLIGDLVDLTHWLTRLKYVPNAPRDVTIAEAQITQGQNIAETLSMSVLGRCWQILLKGYQDVMHAPNPYVAAEMVLIRMAHITDLPTPEDLIKQYEAAPATTPQTPPAPVTPPQNTMTQADAPTYEQGAPGANMAATKRATQTNTQTHIHTFQDIVSLIAAKGEAALHHILDQQARLNTFQPPAPNRMGHIELRFTGDAAQKNMLMQELPQKLLNWTQQSWIVSLAQDETSSPPTMAAMDETTAQREKLLQDPLIRTTLDIFPDAEITAITETGAETMTPEYDGDDG